MLIVLALLVAPAVGVGLGAPAPATVVVPLGQAIYERAAHDHAFRAGHPMASADPLTHPFEQARRELAETQHHGKTPIEWLGVADAQRLLELRAAPREASLEASLARLATLAGVDATPAALLETRARADAMPPEPRARLASLVAAVADAYEAQLPLAAEAAAQWPASWDERTRGLTPAQSLAMAANAEALLGALMAFRDATAGAESVSFADPLGLVILGGAGADVHRPLAPGADPILIVDLGGDDTYLTSAGGACAVPIAHACNLRAVSVVLDVAGADVYSYDGAPNAVQGAGSVGAIGMLVDLAGDDAYVAKMTRATGGPFFSYVDGGAQGFSQAGFGLLLDAGGEDTYQLDVRSANGRSIWAFGQGFGGLGGVGFALDAGGADRYVANGLGIDDGAGGFQGVYTNGVGFYGGVGVQADTGRSNDVYRAWNEGATVDYYAQGFGAFGGLGVLLEDGGNDDYAAVEKATAPGVFIVPLLNCAYGTGSLGGTGIMLELGGDDRYYGASYSPRKAYVMNEGFGGIGAGYGLLVDVSGDDGHFMESFGAEGSDTFGRGVLIEHVSPATGLLDTSGNGGPNRVGNYLDLGGLDTYLGAPPSRDGAQWSGGADVNGPDLVTLLGWSP